MFPEVASRWVAPAAESPTEGQAGPGSARRRARVQDPADSAVADPAAGPRNAVKRPKHHAGSRPRVTEPGGACVPARRRRLAAPARAPTMATLAAYPNPGQGF